MKNLDIRPITDGWPYDPDKITVRKIVGKDGRSKIQMRVDLGVLQMETVGRPDGETPHDRESLLHYHLERLSEFERKNGTEIGFEMTPDECRELREEAFMYYQRYLSEFVLEEFDAVARDTARNLQVLDLCLKCGSDQHDRFALEQYRPYILMMNTRARAFLAEKQSDFAQAVRIVDEALDAIQEFFKKYDQPNAYEESEEVHVLQALRDELDRKLPLSPLERIRKDLEAAVNEERFEDAAKLRDQLQKLES